MLVETEAIVLKVRKFSDSSKIVVLFSKEFGKISVIAKGAFSAKSKFGGGLEPLSYINISFYKKASSELHLLKSLELITLFNRTLKNYNALLTNFVSAEMLGFTQADNCVNYELFANYIEYAENLNIRVDNAFLYGIIFMFKLATHLGLNVDFKIPEFIYEMKNNDLPNEVKISLQDGSFITTLKDNKFAFYSFNLPTIQKIAKLDITSYNSISEINAVSKINIVSEISIEINEYIEVINFFVKYFSYHLGCAISLQSIDLLQF